MHQPDLEKHSPLRLAFGAVRAFPWMFGFYVLMKALIDELIGDDALGFAKFVVAAALIEASLIVPASAWLLTGRKPTAASTQSQMATLRVAIWWIALVYLPVFLPAIASIALILAGVLPAADQTFKGAIISAGYMLLAGTLAMLGTALPEVVHRSRGSLIGAFRRGRAEFGPTLWALIRYPALIAALSFALLFVLAARGVEVSVFDPSRGIVWAGLPVSLLAAAISGLVTLTITAVLCRTYARTTAL